MVRPVVIALACATALLFRANTARATLLDDVRKLDLWIAETAGVVAGPSATKFLEEGRVLEVAAPPATSPGKCRSVVLLAARTVRFSAVFAPESTDVDEMFAWFADRESPRRRSSESGVLVLSGCDAGRASIERILVRMDSPRGTIELRSATGTEPLPAPEAAIGRIAGPVAQRGDPGPPLVVSSLATRRAAAESRARAEGATNVITSFTKAGRSGTGEHTFKVTAGCHRFDVMAEVAEGAAGFDLDVELRDADTGQRIARDRGEAPDARLDACFGRTTELGMVFGGAPQGARLAIHDAVFPVPEGVSAHWGPRAQAGLLTALKKRLRRGPDRAPLFEALGAQGTTRMSLPVEPGSCYIAAATLLRGSSRGMRLLARAEARATFEEVPPAESSASVMFCSDTSSHAELTLDVPGASIGWVLAVWQLLREPTP